MNRAAPKSDSGLDPRDEVPSRHRPPARPRRRRRRRAAAAAANRRRTRRRSQRVPEGRWAARRRRRTRSLASRSREPACPTSAPARTQQGLQNYRHLKKMKMKMKMKMTIPISMLDVMPTAITALTFHERRTRNLSDVLPPCKPLGPKRIAGYAANKCFAFISEK